MNAKTMSDGNRIVNAIQRLLDDLEVIQYIPLFQSHIPPEDFQAFPDSVQQTITQMFEMEQSLRERMRPSSAKVNDFTEYRESVKVKVREVVDAIHEHKLIGKLRKDQPTVPDDSIFLEVIYMNTGTEKLPTSIDSSHHQASNIVWFRKVMKELKLLWEEKLETTVEEDQIRADLKDEVTAREKKANADLKALQRELSTEQNIREKEVSLREESLNKVSDELSKLRSVTSAQRKEFESFIEEKDSIAMGQYTKVTEKLDQIMNQKKQDLQTKETEHASQERQRLTDKKGLEDAIDRIIVGFEEKTRTAQTEIARLEREVSEIDQQLHFFEEKIKEMKEERIRKQELEEKQMELERIRKNKEIQRTTAAVVTIQKAWREFKKRKEEKRAAKRKASKKIAKK